MSSPGEAVPGLPARRSWSRISGAEISVPPLPERSVQRPALVAGLDRRDDDAVTLICAPAGYGKTLLLAEWVRGGGDVPTAWVSLSVDTNDDHRFWSAVLTALTSCAEVPADSVLRSIEIPVRPSTAPGFLAEVLDGLSSLPTRVRIILDDIHEITDADALHGLEMLMRRRPTTVQLVLSSRFDPPLSFARLRLTGQLHELRARDLRFSADEADSLLRAVGIELPDDQLAMLVTRTEGWPAGIRLAAVSMQKSPDHAQFLADFATNDHSVADYLIDEVLSGLPAATREFLRAISVCDQLPVALAVVLSGRVEAGELLGKLEHDTSLVARIGAGADYRIHSLLRAHLVADLRRQRPDLFVQLNERAARWLDGAQRPVDALRHAFLAGDDALMSALLHKHAPGLVMSGERAVFASSMTALRSGVNPPGASLELLAAIADLAAGDSQTAELHLERAMGTGDAGDPGAGVGDVGEAGAGEPVAALQSIVAAQQAALSGDRAAVARASESLEVDAAAHWGLGAVALLAQGTARLLAGDLDAAGPCLRSALEIAREDGQGFLVAQCLAMSATVAAARGDHRGMAAMARQAGAELVGLHLEATPTGALAECLLAFGALLGADIAECARRSARAESLLASITGSDIVGLRSFVATLRGTAAFEIEDRAAGLALLRTGRQVAGDVPLAAAQVAAAALLEHRAATTLGWMEQARAAMEWAQTCPDAAGEVLIMRARTKVATRRHQAAHELLRPLLDGTVATLLPWSPVEAWLLAAEIALVSGARAPARTALEQALTIAEPMDVVYPFVFSSAAVLELMARQLGSFGAQEGFVVRVLRDRKTLSRLPRSVPLTERERAVLQLLPTMESLEEIASDLTLSLNTVKTHVRAIYAKLGVRSRRQAVASAHDEGLIAQAGRARAAREQIPHPRQP